MGNFSIDLKDIRIGQPLAWDVFDDKGHLLLSAGHVIHSEQQAQSLIARGIFAKNRRAETNAQDNAADGGDTPPAPSALRLINSANEQLETLLLGLPEGRDLSGGIHKVVALIQSAADINDSVALASVMLNRRNGNYPVRHSIDTAIISLLATRQFDMHREDVTNMLAGALTMNIGLLADQEQLQKVRDPNTAQRLAIKAHPQAGVSILKIAGVDNTDWLAHVLLHHENEQGTGYPSGKNAKPLSLGTRMLSTADRYCAKISARAYRNALLPNAALRSILREEKNQSIVAAFVRELGIYPMGTFVKLENGEMAVITGKGKTSTTPIVHALIGPRGAPLPFPVERDTSVVFYEIRDVVSDVKTEAFIDMQQLWGLEASL